MAFFIMGIMLIIPGIIWHVRHMYMLMKEHQNDTDAASIMFRKFAFSTAAMDGTILAYALATRPWIFYGFALFIFILVIGTLSFQLYFYWKLWFKVDEAYQKEFKQHMKEDLDYVESKLYWYTIGIVVHITAAAIFILPRA